MTTLRLTHFELRKALHGWFFWVLLLVLLVVNVLLLIEPWQNPYVKTEAYERVDPQLAQLFNHPDSVEYANMLQYATAMYGGIGDRVWETPVSNDFRAESGRYALTRGEEMMAFSFLGVRESTSNVLLARQQIVANAMRLNRLKSATPYAIRHNNSIIRLYAQDLSPTGWRNAEAWLFFFQHSSGFVWTGILLVFSLFSVFSGEYVNNTQGILQASRFGNHQTVCAKFLASALIGIGLLTFFTVVSLIAVGSRFDFHGLSYPIQTALGGVSSLLTDGWQTSASLNFALSPWLLTIGQYLVVQFGFQCFGVLVLVAFLCLFSSLFRSNLISFCLGLLFFALPFGTGLIQKENGDHFLLFSLFQHPDRFFTRDQTINIFGFPVFQLWIFGGFWLSLALLAMFVTTLRFGGRKGRV